MNAILGELETKVIDALRREAVLRVTRQAIRVLRRTETVEQDNEIGLGSVWESICFQRQAEESYFYEIYLDTARTQVAHFIDQLSEHEKIALWLLTDQAFDWREDFEPSMSDEFVLQSITEHVIDQHLLTAAESWSNSKLRRAINRHEINCYGD